MLLIAFLRFCDREPARSCHARTHRAGVEPYLRRGHALAYGARMASPFVELDVLGRSVRITNPDRVYFPARGETKLDVANYYISVGDGIVRALRDRPCMLHRYPEGVDGEKIYQKRLPKGAPDWVHTVEVSFPSGRTAEDRKSVV